MCERRFCWDEAENCGPIVVQVHLENQTMRLDECIADLFQVTPDPEPGGVVCIDQPGPATPPTFRNQFVAIFAEHDLKEIKLIEDGDRLLRIGNAFVSGRELSSEELAALGRYLFQLVLHLRPLSLD